MRGSEISPAGHMAGFDLLYAAWNGMFRENTSFHPGRGEALEKRELRVESKEESGSVPHSFQLLLDLDLSTLRRRECKLSSTRTHDSSCFIYITYWADTRLETGCT
jgi:hypothetical protein